MQKIREEGRSKPAPHNEENFMDCVVKDLNYGGVDVEFSRGYEKGNYAEYLRKEAKASGVREGSGKKEMKSYREKPMKMSNKNKRDMDAY